MPSNINRRIFNFVLFINLIITPIVMVINNQDIVRTSCYFHLAPEPLFRAIRNCLPSSLHTIPPGLGNNRALQYDQSLNKRVAAYKP